MTEPLQLKYRPQSFDSIVGQRLSAVVLQQMVATNSVPHGILFSGPRGTGKTSMARILAMELNPSDREEILSGRSLAVIEIDAASHGSVADIRSLSEQLGYSVGAERRVVILDEAHSITREGFNALLKTLEEPPPGVVFVLVTTEPQKLPDTILSRVMEFEFRRIAPEELLTRVLDVARLEEIELADGLAGALVESADGSARDALKYLDFVHRAEIKSVEEFTELIGKKDYGPQLLGTLLTNDHARIFSLVDEILLETGDPRVVGSALTDIIADVFALKAGGEVKASGKAWERRVKLAKITPNAALYDAVQILWDLKTRVRWSEDQRAALYVALILVADKLTEGREREVEEPVTPSTPEISEVASEEGARTLSLSELQQM